MQGSDFPSVVQAAKQWLELYDQSLEPSTNIEIVEYADRNILLHVDKKVDNERFGYLVNYLVYPEALSVNHSVLGYTRISNASEYPEELLNQMVQMYIPEEDTEHDNVYILSRNNETIKYGFSGNTLSVQSTRKYSEPNFSDHPQIQKTTLKSSDNKPSSQHAGHDHKFKKRLWLPVSIIAISYVIMTFFIKNVQVYPLLSFFSGILVFAWLMFDYKLLQKNKYYIQLLLVSIAIGFYGIYISTSFDQYDGNTHIWFGSLEPLSFMIIQKPIRILFMSLMKREPIVDKPAPSLPDGLYMLALFALSQSIVVLIVPF